MRIRGGAHGGNSDVNAVDGHRLTRCLSPVGLWQTNSTVLAGTIAWNVVALTLGGDCSIQRDEMPIRLWRISVGMTPSAVGN
jgi:hypothetical protein